MNNINWKARLKSGPFWMGVISALVTAVFAILPLCGVEIPVTVEQVMNGVTLFLMVLASIGIISDPTTKGIADSSRALTYAKPAENARQETKRLAAEAESTTTE